MQICPKCGAEIKYITTGYDITAICESSPLEVVSERGHRFSGYPLHECKEEKEADERNDAKNN